MGHSCTLRCDNCGLTGLVDGGDSCGRMAFTTTVYCSACESLSDITTGYREGYAEGREAPQFVCGKCCSGAISKWSRKQPCPRCGGEIGIDPNGESLLWD